MQEGKDPLKNLNEVKGDQISKAHAEAFLKDLKELYRGSKEKPRWITATKHISDLISSKENGETNLKVIKLLRVALKDKIPAIQAYEGKWSKKNLKPGDLTQNEMYLLCSADALFNGQGTPETIMENKAAIIGMLKEAEDEVTSPKVTPIETTKTEQKTDITELLKNPLTKEVTSKDTTKETGKNITPPDITKQTTKPEDKKPDLPPEPIHTPKEEEKKNIEHIGSLELPRLNELKADQIGEAVESFFSAFSKVIIKGEIFYARTDQLQKELPDINYEQPTPGEEQLLLEFMQNNPKAAISISKLVTQVYANPNLTVLKDKEEDDMRDATDELQDTRLHELGKNQSLKLDAKQLKKAGMITEDQLSKKIADPDPIHLQEKITDIQNLEPILLTDKILEEPGVQKKKRGYMKIQNGFTDSTFYISDKDFARFTTDQKDVSGSEKNRYGKLQNKEHEHMLIDYPLLAIEKYELEDLKEKRDIRSPDNNSTLLLQHKEQEDVFCTLDMKSTRKPELKFTWPGYTELRIIVPKLELAKDDIHRMVKFAELYTPFARRWKKRNAKEGTNQQTAQLAYLKQNAGALITAGQSLTEATLDTHGFDIPAKTPISIDDFSRDEETHFLHLAEPTLPEETTQKELPQGEISFEAAQKWATEHKFGLAETETHINVLDSNKGNGTLSIEKGADGTRFFNVGDAVAIVRSPDDFYVVGPRARMHYFMDETTAMKDGEEDPNDMYHFDLLDGKASISDGKTGEVFERYKKYCEHILQLVNKSE